MHHTGKKEIKKKKKEKKWGYEKFATRGFQSGPQNQLELKVNASTHWTTSVNADNLSLKEVYIPSLWWLTVVKDDSFVFFFNISVELNL